MDFTKTSRYHAGSPAGFQIHPVGTAAGARLLYVIGTIEVCQDTFFLIRGLEPSVLMGSWNTCSRRGGALASKFQTWQIGHTHDTKTKLQHCIGVPRPTVFSLTHYANALRVCGSESKSDSRTMNYCTALVYSSRLGNNCSHMTT